MKILLPSPLYFQVSIQQSALFVHYCFLLSGVWSHHCFKLCDDFSIKLRNPLRLLLERVRERERGEEGDVTGPRKFLRKGGGRRGAFLHARFDVCG